MEKFIEKIFNIKEMPTKIIFVIWLCAAFILFVPEQFLTRLNLTDFLQDYGKYIGIAFVISFVFLLVAFVSNIAKYINQKRTIKRIEYEIIETINSLDFHEKALLREFFINDKNTLQLPFDNDTVAGLVNKYILEQASDYGFTYIQGAYFSYSITKFARKNLTNEMVDIPRNITESDKKRIFNERPSWAKNRS